MTVIRTVSEMAHWEKSPLEDHVASKAIPSRDSIFPRLHLRWLCPLTGLKYSPQPRVVLPPSVCHVTAAASRPVVIAQRNSNADEGRREKSGPERRLSSKDASPPAAPPGISTLRSGACMTLGQFVVRYFTPEDVTLRNEIGYGANGHVFACDLHTPEGKTLPELFAIKLTQNSHALERECETMEALRRIVPDSIVPYVGRYYCDDSVCDLSSTYPLSAPRPGLVLSGVVMEYMPYSDFFDLLNYLQEPTVGKPRRTLHPHVARWYAIDILNRIYSLHYHGYYHGDIKPENLMMRADGHIVLGDLGETRKDIPENWVMPNLGTPTTQAPELYENWEGPRRPSDIWSVGVILFDMLFGHMPFEGRNPTDVYHSMHDFIDCEMWPEITEADPYWKEREEGLEFLKKMLVPAVRDRIWWLDIKSHPWIRDEWQIVANKEREAPLIRSADKWIPGKGWTSFLCNGSSLYSANL